MQSNSIFMSKPFCLGQTILQVNTPPPPPPAPLRQVHSLFMKSILLSLEYFVLRRVNFFKVVTHIFKNWLRILELKMNVSLKIQPKEIVLNGHRIIIL